MQRETNVSLRNKLFCLFLSVSTIILLLIYGVNRSQFERGFDEVKRQHERRYTRMLTERAEALYGVDRSWLNVQSDPQRWLRWMERPPRHHDEHEHRERHAEHDDEDVPPPRRPGFIPPDDDHLPAVPAWLLDDGQNIIAGALPYPALKQLTLKPLYDQRRQLIGYLGLRQREPALLDIDNNFEQTMLKHLAINVLFAVFGSMLLSYGLAYWLVRRLALLRAGAQILRDGDYDYRLDARSKDEIDDLARDFNALAEHLAQSQKQRQQGFAEFAHELRTPIAVLRAEIEAMQSGIRPLSTDALHSLASEVQQLMRLVDDLNMLQRAEVAKLQLHIESCDLVTLINAVATVHGEKFRAHDLQWTLLAPSSLVVDVDRGRMRQVLHNLFENAVRYCVHGARVQLTVEQHPRYWRWRWEDSGPGVSSNDLPHLFDRYFRAHARLANEGSGLGLAIVRALVLAHGGSIVAMASPLGGLAIIIEIPYDAAHSDR